MTYEDYLQNFLSFVRSHRAPQIVSIIFGVFLFYSVIQLIVVFWPESTQKIEDPILTAKVQPLPDIPNWHLFGDYAMIKAGLLPLTQLNLTLEGIFYSDNPTQSQVLVSASNVPGKIYKINDELPGGAKIKEILPNGVIIEYENKLQNLPLKKPKLQFAPRPRGFDAIRE